MAARITRQTIRRNIAAATEAGLSVFGISPNGTVLTAAPGALPELSSSKQKSAENSCDEIMSRLMGSD